MARDNRKILIPTEVIDSLVSTDLNLAGLRIVLGLLHAQEIVDGWDKGSQIPGAPSSFFVPTADLRERVFPPSASDNRALHAALPGLQACGWLKHIDVCKAGRFITWTFDESVTHWMVERPNPYALVDLNLVRQMKSRVQLVAYLMVQSRIRMNYPMFEMTISEGHWKVERQKFLRALGQIATSLVATFHVASCYHRDRPELGRLVVKIVTDKTRWRGHALRKFDRNAGIAVIKPHK
ncbi:MAG: hypothetical protein KDK53_23080 [Maritimibacter sp.]|nr:hypothetical protein [Maritimibacter sp.]